MDKTFDYLPASDTVIAFINDFLNYRKNVNRDSKRAVENYLEILKYDIRKPDVSNIVDFTSKRYSTKDFVSYVNNLVDIFGFDRDKIYNEFQDYRENIIRIDDPIKYKNIIKQKYPDLASQKEKIEKQLKEIHEIENKYIRNNRIGNILNEINNLRQQMIDLNSKGVEDFKFYDSQIRELDNLLKNIENKINPPKPILTITQPDNYFGFNPTYNYTLSKTYNTASIEPQKQPLTISQQDNYFGFNPTYNYTLQKDYNTLSIKPLQEDNNTLSKANKKLQDDYNELSIAKNQLEIKKQLLEEDYKNINEKKEEIEKLNITLKNELDRLDNEFNDKVKIIIGKTNKQIEELKKKNKLAIDKGTEFEVNNKKMDVKDIQTDTPTQINKDVQTTLPSLYITDFRETYNQQGDYNKRVEAIQENAKRKIEAIKNIYNQSKADLQDEFNNLTNKLKEEYRNKKIRQNEYFEIPSKEQPEDNNTTKKLFLTNNKVMADINPQIKMEPTHNKTERVEKILTGEQPAEEQPAEEQPAEEQPAEEQPAEEQPAEEQPTKDILDDANTSEEEDEKLEEEDKPEEKKEEKKIIPIEKVGEELAKIIDSFYIQDKPIEETFSKLEETINNIPDELFYQIQPYIASALANITVDGQKVFNDEAEVQQLLLKIKNPNKINKRYKLPKHLDKALTQSNQKQLTISPMLLRNRKQTNINKNIYQY